MAVDELMFDLFAAEIDQLAVVQVGQHEVLNQLSAMPVVELRNDLQFEWASGIHHEVHEIELFKIGMSQSYANFLDRAGTKNVGQGEPIDRFVEDPAQPLVDVEGVPDHFIRDSAKVRLRNRT